MRIKSAAVTCAGKIKSSNADVVFIDGILSKEEDCIITEEEHRDMHLFAIFDGISAVADSRKAAWITAEELAKIDIKSMNESGKFLSDFLIDTNKLLDQIIKSTNISMGCTAVIASIAGREVRVCNIGDSRAYVMNSEGLRQISKDHTRVQQMIDAGIIAENKRFDSRFNHELTQWLGENGEQILVSPFESELIRLNGDDILMLCSDGLTDMICDEKLKMLIRGNESPETLARKLVLEAINEGGRDNISVIVIKVEEDERLEQVRTVI